MSNTPLYSVLYQYEVRAAYLKANSYLELVPTPMPKEDKHRSRKRKIDKFVKRNLFQRLLDRINLNL